MFSNKNDKKPTFYKLLEKDGSVSIHKQNSRFLACEMIKLKKRLTPELIKELILLNRQHRYELRNNQGFAVQIVKSVHKDLESLSYLGPKILESLSLEIKKKQRLCHNSKLRLKIGISKLSLSSLQNILPEYWIQLG